MMKMLPHSCAHSGMVSPLVFAMLENLHDRLEEIERAVEQRGGGPVSTARLQRLSREGRLALDHLRRDLASGVDGGRGRRGRFSPPWRGEDRESRHDPIADSDESSDNPLAMGLFEDSDESDDGPRHVRVAAAAPHRHGIVRSPVLPRTWSEGHVEADVAAVRAAQLFGGDDADDETDSSSDFETYAHRRTTSTAAGAPAASAAPATAASAAPATAASAATAAAASARAGTGAGNAGGGGSAPFWMRLMQSRPTHEGLPI